MLHVLYLVFNEGHTASRGEELIRAELCAEAIRLTRLTVELLPDHAEPLGLLALLLLTDARRAARTDDAGRPVALEDQDRARWDQAAIDDGTVRARAGTRPRGTRAVPGAGRHRRLARRGPGVGAHRLAPDRRVLRRARAARPVTRRHVEPRGRRGAGRRAPGRAWRSWPRSSPTTRLARYQPLHAARAELLARAGDRAGAESAYDDALALTDNQVERAALERRRRRLLARLDDD